MMIPPCEWQVGEPAVTKLSGERHGRHVNTARRTQEVETKPEIVMYIEKARGEDGPGKMYMSPGLGYESKWLGVRRPGV